MKAVEYRSTNRTQREVLIQERIQKCWHEINANTLRFFPIRTHGLITTLQIAPSLITSANAWILLVGGGHHLEEDPNAAEETKKYYSLNELYSFLKEHKNIVVLRPKIMR
jgi:hypothetical protein